MKIVMITNLFPPHVRGGYELGCLDLARQFKAAGHSVVVATAASSLKQRQYPPADDVDAREIFPAIFEFDAYHLQVARDFPDQAYYTQLMMAGYSEANCLALRRLLELEKPDLIWGFNLLGLGPLGIMDTALSYPGARVMIHLMDHQDDCIEVHWKSFNLAEKYAFLKARCGAIFCSRMIGASNERLGPYQQSRVIYNGIDTTLFARKPEARREGKFRIVNFGQMDKIKGVEQLLGVAGMLAEEGLGEKLQIDIYGRGEAAYLEKLEKLRTSSSGVAQIVNFKGFVPKAELAEILPGYDLGIFLLSDREPFAYAPLEALFAGAPCIIPGNIPMSEIFHEGADDLLVDDRDNAREIADLIIRCMKEPAFLRDAGDRMLEWAKAKFDLNAVVIPDITDFIQSLPVQKGYDFDRVMAVAQMMRFNHQGAAHRKLQGQKLPLGAIIDFSREGNSAMFTGRGWGRAEAWGTWTEGDEATLEIPFAAVPRGAFKIKALLSGHVSPTHPEIFVEVSVDEEVVAKWVVKKRELRQFSARVPKDLVNSAECRISFKILNPISPNAMDGVSEDFRRLGAGFGRVEFEFPQIPWF